METDSIRDALIDYVISFFDHEKVIGFTIDPVIVDIHTIIGFVFYWPLGDRRALYLLEAKKDILGSFNGYKA